MRDRRKSSQENLLFGATPGKNTMVSNAHFPFDQSIVFVISSYSGQRTHDQPRLMNNGLESSLGVMTILTYLACEPRRINNFSALRICCFRLFSQDAHCSLIYQHLWKWVVTKFRLILTPGHQGWSIRWIWWLRSRTCFCLKWVTVIHFNRAPPNSKTWKSHHNSSHWFILSCTYYGVFWEESKNNCAALYQWSIVRTTDWFVLCELVRIPSTIKLGESSMEVQTAKLSQSLYRTQATTDCGSFCTYSYLLTCIRGYLNLLGDTWILNMENTCI